MNQLTDHSNRRDLEKTRQLLQDARQVCPADSVTNKIQLALLEIDKVLSGGSPAAAANAGGTRKVTRMKSDPAGMENLVCDGETFVGDLWKRGSRLRQMIKRHYVMQGNFLYYYAYVTEVDPVCFVLTFWMEWAHVVRLLFR